MKKVHVFVEYEFPLMYCLDGHHHSSSPSLITSCIYNSLRFAKFSGSGGCENENGKVKIKQLSLQVLSLVYASTFVLVPTVQF